MKDACMSYVSGKDFVSFGNQGYSALLFRFSVWYLVRILGLKEYLIVMLVDRVFFLRLVIWLTPFHVFLLFHKFSLNNWYSVGFTIPDCSNQTIAVFFVILKNIAFEKRAFFFLKFMKHFFSCIYHFLSFFIQGLWSLFFC